MWNKFDNVYTTEKYLNCTFFKFTQIPLRNIYRSEWCCSFHLTCKSHISHSWSCIQKWTMPFVMLLFCLLWFFSFKWLIPVENCKMLKTCVFWIEILKLHHAWELELTSDIWKSDWNIKPLGKHLPPHIWIVTTCSFPSHVTETVAGLQWLWVREY